MCAGDLPQTQGERQGWEQPISPSRASGAQALPEGGAARRSVGKKSDPEGPRPALPWACRAIMVPASARTCGQFTWPPVPCRGWGLPRGCPGCGGWDVEEAEACLDSTEGVDIQKKTWSRCYSASEPRGSSGHRFLADSGAPKVQG